MSHDDVAIDVDGVFEAGLFEDGEEGIAGFWRVEDGTFAEAVDADEVKVAGVVVAAEAGRHFGSVNGFVCGGFGDCGLGSRVVPVWDESGRFLPETIPHPSTMKPSKNGPPGLVATMKKYGPSVMDGPLSLCDEA